jgi:heme oxygenase
LKVSSIHAELRGATRALHDRIEAVVGLPERVTTVAEYRVVLERFWGFHAPLEAALAERDWRGFDFERRRRAHEAAADLAALGERDLEGLPLWEGYRPGSEAEAFGVLYVLEGSTLGGRVIRRGLDARLGAQVAGATRFFDGRGRTGAKLWREFLTTLDVRVRTTEERAAAVHGAQAAFQAMIDWFEPRCGDGSLDGPGGLL